MICRGDQALITIRFLIDSDDIFFVILEKDKSPQLSMSP
jgi:hypothetical protein